MLPPSHSRQSQENFLPVEAKLSTKRRADLPPSPSLRPPHVSSFKFELGRAPSTLDFSRTRIELGRAHAARPSLHFSFQLSAFSSAFTLIELLVVCGITALLMMLALPAFNAINGAGSLTKGASDLQGFPRAFSLES